MPQRSDDTFGDCAVQSTREGQYVFYTCPTLGLESIASGLEPKSYQEWDDAHIRAHVVHELDVAQDNFNRRYGLGKYRPRIPVNPWTRYY